MLKYFRTIAIGLRHSGAADGGRVRTAIPGKLNIITGPAHGLYFGVSILLLFSRFLFFVFFGVISGDLEF